MSIGWKYYVIVYLAKKILAGKKGKIILQLIQAYISSYIQACISSYNSACTMRDVSRNVYKDLNEHIFD